MSAHSQTQPPSPSIEVYDLIKYWNQNLIPAQNILINFLKSD